VPRKFPGSGGKGGRLYEAIGLWHGHAQTKQD
jgi:hypothetical protein